MKVFFHFSVAGFSNTYLIGPDDGGDAVIVDPGAMNVGLLNLIESNNYYVRNVLLTHTHGSHVSGLKTLSKIYDFTIHADTDKALYFDCRRIDAGEDLQLGELVFRTYSLGGHSSDSVAYSVGTCLFTGDILGAGTVGTTPNGYARELLIDAIKSQLLDLEENLLIFPGHGAPSTLESERLLNPIFA